MYFDSFWEKFMTNLCLWVRIGFAWRKHVWGAILSANYESWIVKPTNIYSIVFSET